MNPLEDKGGSHSGQASVCGPLVDRDGPLQPPQAISFFTTRGGEGKSTFSLIFLKGFHWESLVCWDLFLILFCFFLLEKSKVRSRFFIGN